MWLKMAKNLKTLPKFDNNSKNGENWRKGAEFGKKLQNLRICPQKFTFSKNLPHKKVL
jgi:hypothetical protein